MATYNVELWQPLGSVLTNLPGAREKKLTLSVDEGETFSFVLDAFDEKAVHIEEMFTDVKVYREGVAVYRGRIVSAVQQGDATGATITVNCVDYKTLLRRRFMHSAGINSGDLEAVAWSFIDAVQQRTLHGSFGITRGENQSIGQHVDYRRSEGSSVADVIDQLAATNSASGATQMFEWTIDPDLVFRVFTPTRGRRTPSFVCDYGGSVLSYDTAFDPNSYANYFYVQGAGAYKSSGILDESFTKPGGTFEEYINDSNLTSPALVDSRAFWLMTYNGQVDLCKSYNLEISQGRWNGPEDMWIGDFVTLDINHGALNVRTEQLRVRNMHIEIGDDGTERVGIEVGFSTPATYRDFNRMSAFMLKNRRDLLVRRSRWYQVQARRIRAEVMQAKAKNGTKSYEYKAAMKRYTDLLNQASRWRTDQVKKHRNL